MILEWTEFYAANYGTEGAVFADDGADGAYCIRPGGTVACISGAEDREAPVADTLWDFFGSDTGFYSNHQNCRHPSGRQLSQLPLSQKLESHQGFLRFWGFGS
jgi:hypothetical protein